MGCFNSPSSFVVVGKKQIRTYLSIYFLHLSAEEWRLDAPAVKCNGAKHFWRDGDTSGVAFSYRSRCRTCSRARCRSGSALNWTGWTGRSSSPTFSPGLRGTKAACCLPVTSRPDRRRRGRGPYPPRSRGGTRPSPSRRRGRAAEGARRFRGGADWSADLKRDRRLKRECECFPVVSVTWLTDTNFSCSC